MTDETQPEAQEPEADAGVAGTATVSTEETEAGEATPEKLKQTVEMNDIGPCKKHIKVTIDRENIDSLLNEKYTELMVDAPVAGFRPGKAPRKIIERRFHKDVADKVRGELLLQSLEQLADENDVAPLTAPNIDPNKIEIPKEGPLVYEFDVEVRPQFDLPNYRGVKLRRPVKTFTEADVDQEERRILAPYGSLVPKPEGNAQVGDYLITDLTTRLDDRVLSEHKEITIRVDPRLALKDGIADHFADQVKGANGNESRTVDITLSDAVSDPGLRGKTVKATFEIKEIKSLRLPELTEQFLEEFGVRSQEQFRERLRVLLERRLEYQQRAAARSQFLEQITAASTWELPEDLLQRQARKALNRRLMEMQSAGMSDEEIRGQLRVLQRDTLQHTALALKEHFVLQKIAEVEKLDIDQDDIDDEIERIAAQSDESPRRVRARLEKDDLMESLAIEIIERKALDLILDNAEYEDVPLEKGEGAVSTMDEQAVPGEMHDPTEVPEEAKEPTAGAEEKPAENQS
jgi:trigger factor